MEQINGKQLLVGSIEISFILYFYWIAKILVHSQFFLTFHEVLIVTRMKPESVIFFRAAKIGGRKKLIISRTDSTLIFYEWPFLLEKPNSFDTTSQLINQQCPATSCSDYSICNICLKLGGLGCYVLRKLNTYTT